jgi:hypothetical protein
MLRIVISGAAALAVGLASGWIFLVATDVEAAPTTAPVTASPDWLHLEPFPTSNADTAASPASKAEPAPLPNSAPGIHAADVPIWTPAPAVVAGPRAKPVTAAVTRDKPHNRIAQRNENEDEDD